MMYGHVDTPNTGSGHLTCCAASRTKPRFTEFVPLPVVHQSSPPHLAGGARPVRRTATNRACTPLPGSCCTAGFDHIQTSW